MTSVAAIKPFLEEVFEVYAVIVVLLTMFVCETTAVRKFVQPRVFNGSNFSHKPVIEKIGHTSVNIFSGPIHICGDICSKVSAFAQFIKDQPIRLDEFHTLSGLCSHRYVTVGKKRLNSQRHFTIISVPSVILSAVYSSSQTGSRSIVRGINVERVDGC